MSYAKWALGCRSVYRSRACVCVTRVGSDGTALLNTHHPPLHDGPRRLLRSTDRFDSCDKSRQVEAPHGSRLLFLKTNGRGQSQKAIVIIIV